MNLLKNKYASCLFYQGHRVAVDSVENTGTNARVFNWELYAPRNRGCVILFEKPLEAHLAWKPTVHCGNRCLLLQCGDIEQNPGPKVICNNAKDFKVNRHILQP